MTRDEMREKVKDAIRDEIGVFESDLYGASIEGFDEAADAVLAAIESTGHVIVPREPTEEMVEAGRRHLGSYMRDGTPHDGPLTPAVVYRAMLDAYGQEGKS